MTFTTPCCDNCRNHEPVGAVIQACMNPDCPCHSPQSKSGWEKRFDLHWGLAPKGTPKYAAAEKAKDFIRANFIPKEQVREAIEETRDTYSPSRSATNAIDDIIKALNL